MKKIKSSKLLAYSILLAVTSSITFAATNPIAPTAGVSQGDFLVSLNKEDMIIINNFQDMSLAQFVSNPSGDYLGAQNVCVGRAGASLGNTSGYSITASNSKGSFFLNNGSDPSVDENNIGYQVYYMDSVLSVQEIDQGNELAQGIQNSNSFSTELADTQCTAGASNSTVWVKASGADIASANTGTYTDTITVTVAVN